MTRGILVTADGEAFEGRAVGAEGPRVGEVVFNTSMTGYQEVLSDPSYAGQIVVMTSPHIGNYGISDHDDQASAPAARGLIVRSLARRHSNWRAEGSLAEYLRRHDVSAIANVDTRRLTRHIRDHGAMPVAIGHDVDTRELAGMAAAAPHMIGQDLVTTVTTPEPYQVDPQGDPVGRVVALDLGLKRDIVRQLGARRLEVHVLPATSNAQSIAERDPTGVFLSYGPGDPEPLHHQIETIRQLLGTVPIGFSLLASPGTARFLEHHGVAASPVNKVGEGPADTVERIESGEVDLVVNTPRGRRARGDGRLIRHASASRGVPCVTTIAGALAVARSLRSGRLATVKVRSLQDWHR